MFALSSLRLTCITLAALAGAFVVALLCAPAAPVRAAGTVGNDTAASCTSKALADAIAAGSGDITFACGAAPVTIVITQPGGLIIPGGVQITIDGNNKIESSGGLASRVFVVNGGGSLTLKNLSVVKGSSLSDDGGAIRNDGTLNIYGCLFADNQTSDSWSGGAILSYGPLNIGNREFRHNQAGNGGAIYPRFAAAVTVITGTTFDFNFTTNATNGWGGAMLLWDGAPVTLVQDNFHDNSARIYGGAVYVQGPSGLTISATQFYSNAGQVSPSQGGAIFSQGTLSVTNSTFDSNHAGNGGAIFMHSGATGILRSLFTRNWAVFGGAYEQEAGELFATDSWFSGNGYDQDGTPRTVNGGAIENAGGNAVLNNLTMNGNWSSVGSGFFQGGTSSLTNVTISGNRANKGGGITQLSGDMTLTHVTVYQNSATSGTGGIERDSGTVTVRNTIVANNTGGNCDAPFASYAFSLSSDSSCGFGIGRDNVTIQLMGLYNYGGFAPTHLPFASSPAVDNATLLYCPATDQRGVLRAGKGSACDVGAVERIPGEQGPALFLPLVRR